MYCSHFGLHRPPFNNTPDPSFYYSTPDHEEALATLQYATLNRKGFVLVTGEVGAGKTLIGRMFIRQVDRQASTAVITHTHLNARQLLAAICGEFELDVPADATNLQLADRLQEYLLDQFARDRFAVVLLDEGQNLPDESFEALRMLGNLEADDAKLLQVCILGQPELRERFKCDSMRQFDQRLFRRFHLTGLTECQTIEYIQRRLSVAGCARADLFSSEALTRIHRASQGIPRLINRICDNALLAAYAHGRDAVDEALVAQVLEQEGLNSICGNSPAAGPNATGATEQKIEQIYGTAPELVEANQAAANSNEDLSELRDVMTRATQQWPALKEAIERHREDLQKSVEDASARCLNAEQQIETIARSAVPVEALDELRKLHQTQTGRVMEEIAASRSSVQSLVAQTEARLAETETRLREIGSNSASVDTVTRLQQRQDQQLHEALAQVEQHRRHIEELIQLLGAQCRETQAGVMALVESQAKTQTAWADRFEEKLSEYQCSVQDQMKTAARVQDFEALRASQQALEANWNHRLDRAHAECTAGSRQIQELRETQQAMDSDWSDRLDRTLADLDSRLKAQLQTVASTDDVEALRQSQAAARQEISRTLAELDKRLKTQFQQVATTDDLEAMKQSQAAAREEISRTLVALSERLQAQFKGVATTTELEALRQAQATTREELDRQFHQGFTEIQRHIQKELEAKASVDDVELVRDAQRQARAELEEQLASIRESLDTELSATVRQDELDEVRQATLAAAHTNASHEAAINSHAEALAGQETAIEDIYASVGRHEDEIRQLSQQAASRFESLTRDIDELREGSSAGANLEQLRLDHNAFARDVLERFEQKAGELEALKSTLDQQLAQATGDQQTAMAELSDRIDAEAKQLRDVRRKLVQSHTVIHKRLTSLDEKYAHRSELDSIRQAQTAQADQVREQMQASREAMHSLMNELAERFRATHQRLDNLSAAAESEGSELADLRRTQAEDVASLLRQLEDQRTLSQEQFEQALARWNQAQQEIDSLRASAADAAALEELRQDQARRSEAMLGMLSEQRQGLEDLIHAADRRCDAMLARIDALPANVASTGDIQALHEESRNNKTVLENAIRSVADQCDQTGRILSTLQDHAASVDSHLEQIRQDHAQNLDEIIQRLDGQSSEYQQEFDALKERWTGLRTELQTLAGSAMPVEKFEAAERLINRDMNALKSRLDQVSDRRQKDVRVLVDVVQRLSDRVKQLEEMDRPQPVRVELRPRAAEELAELNTAAETKVAELRKLLAQMNSTGDELHQATGHVEQVMAGWSEQASRVQAQSEQLRVSATASAGILQAMRKCHDAIDAKLKSAAWHGQMRRAEELTARLEQVLPQYQEFEGVVNVWQEQRKDADALVEHLERLLTEANRATVRLGRVGAMLAGVAGKNTIADTVDAARRYDEQVRPTRGVARKSSHEKPVEAVNWPKYRSHMKANAG